MPPPVAAVLLLWTTAVVAEALVFRAVVECGERSMGAEQVNLAEGFQFLLRSSHLPE